MFMLLQIYVRVHGVLLSHSTLSFPGMETKPHSLNHKQHYGEHSNTRLFMALFRKWFGVSIMREEVVGLPDYPASPWPSLLWPV